MPKLKPTKEQQAIINKAKESDNLLSINALAGSGKTSTLAMVAEAIQKPSSLMVFNKSAQVDAESRFPPHVDVKTTHSVAYGAVGCNYFHKLNRPKGGYVNVAYTGSEIGRFFRIKPEIFKGKLISSAYIGLMVRNCVEKFEQSADPKITKGHVTKEAKNLKLTGTILNYAKRLWKERINLHSDVLISHDTYMKLFQLSSPKLNYSVIYLDEAQDTTLCTLDIILQQASHAKIILVGDKHQSIYSWRGSVNAMSLVEGDEMFLSKSFRFGNEVAKIANVIVEGIDMQGNENLETIVGRDVVDRSKCYTILYRTNAALLVDALKEIGKGVKINLEINTGDLCKQLVDAEQLYFGNKNKVKHENLLMFNSWEELKQESKHNPELSRIATIVESNQVPKVVYTLNNHRNTPNPDIIMTTAHKAKGREWDQVVLADDYPSNFEGNEYKGLTKEEINLLYVAATRGKLALEVNDTVEEFYTFYEESLNPQVVPLKDYIPDISRISGEGSKDALHRAETEYVDEIHGDEIRDLDDCNLELSHLSQQI